nr:phospholipase-like protein [Tanacetum cinerariifolium]
MGLSPLVDDDVGEEEAIENNTKVVINNNEEDESIEVDEVANVNESKSHPPYDYKVTIRSKLHTIPFIKERLSKSNKRMNLFKDIVFGKYLDLDMEGNDNHLMNYVLHHQRPDLSESIDSNLVFDIAGHTLLFKSLFRFFDLLFRSNPLRCVPFDLIFRSLGKAARRKATRGKAANGKAAKGKNAKHIVSQGQEDKKVVKNSMLRLVEDLAAWDDFSWVNAIGRIL